MFEEETCNASGNRLISFLNEVELVICNGRKLVSEPKWTRVRPSVQQKSVIDYIYSYGCAVDEGSGDVQVNITDLGALDHFLVRLELGHVTKCCKKRWWDDEIKQKIYIYYRA